MSKFHTTSASRTESHRHERLLETTCNSEFSGALPWSNGCRCSLKCSAVRLDGKHLTFYALQLGVLPTWKLQTLRDSCRGQFSGRRRRHRGAEAQLGERHRGRGTAPSFFLALLQWVEQLFPHGCSFWRSGCAYSSSLEASWQAGCAYFSSLEAS